MNTEPFVLLSTQRSGSTWAIQMLQSHPAVTAYGEVFNTEGQGTPPRGAQDLPFFSTWSLETRGTREEFLDLVFAARKGVAAAGFKLMVGQAGAHPGLVTDLAGRGIRVVHLVRANLIDIILSKNSAAQRSQFSAAPGDPVQPVQMKLNVKRLLARLEEQERETTRGSRLFADLDAPTLEVRYEVLSQDPSEFSHVLRFLGVPEPDRQLHSGMRKMNTQHRTEMIENCESVREVLRGTRFEWMLEATAPPVAS